MPTDVKEGRLEPLYGEWLAPPGRKNLFSEAGVAVGVAEEGETTLPAGEEDWRDLIGGRNLRGLL